MKIKKPWANDLERQELLDQIEKVKSLCEPDGAVRECLREFIILNCMMSKFIVNSLKS